METDKELELIRADCARAGLEFVKAQEEYRKLREFGHSPNSAYFVWRSRNSYLLSQEKGDYTALVLAADRFGRLKLSKDEWDQIRAGTMEFPKGPKDKIREMEPDAVYMHDITLGLIIDGEVITAVHTAWDDPAKRRENPEAYSPFLERVDQLSAGQMVVMKGAGYVPEKDRINMGPGSTLELVDDPDMKQKIWKGLPAVDMGRYKDNLNQVLVYQGRVGSVSLNTKKETGKQTLFYSIGTAEEKDIMSMSDAERKEYFHTLDFAYWPEDGSDEFPSDEAYYRKEYEAKVVKFVAKIWKNKQGDFAGKLMLI